MDRGREKVTLKEKIYDWWGPSNSNWRLFLWLVIYGEKEWGWEGRDEWPNKPYFWMSVNWYDGPLFGLHLYKFYFGMH